MAVRSHSFSVAHSLVYWDDALPPGLGPFRHDEQLSEVRTGFGGRDGVAVGVVNELHSLIVDSGATLGAVYALSPGAAGRVVRVLDARAYLAQIADWMALLWAAHPGAVALPYDPGARATAAEVLAEFAANNPGSDITFWRHHYFRQYDIRITV